MAEMEISTATASMNAANEALAKSALTPSLARAAMTAMMTGEADTESVKTFLKNLTLEHCTSPIVSALADETRQNASNFAHCGKGLDIVGTGGDGKNTFNISTAASFIIAAAGVRVTKHGNNAASSRSGSADLLKSLGVELALGPVQTGQVLADCGMCFLYARKFHPSMRHVAPIRRELKIRTVFNILGPLTNPSKPQFQLSGVFDSSIGKMYIESLKAIGVERAMVVCGKEGLDEISIAGPSDYWLLENGEITEGEITPEDFGIARASLDLCKSGSPEENAEELKRIFSGKTGPVTDFVCMNAAAALKVAGKAKTFREAMKLARSVIQSGAAMITLNKFIAATQLASKTPQMDILTKIVANRTIVIEQERLDPVENWRTPLPKALNVLDRVRLSQPIAVMAEYKKASPSKGIINDTVSPEEQALAYAKGGCAVISCLTEPKWFKGSMDYLTRIRKAIDKLPNRPAVLLKDFVVHRSQIYRARAAGADTILLIVSCFTQNQKRLKSFIKISRSQGMEPLVEVNGISELDIALNCGAKFIGVNNRNLKTFEVDPKTTDKVCEQLKDRNKEVVVAALSGIKTASDVQGYLDAGCKAVLVGESLMRVSDPASLVKELSLRGPLTKVVG